MAMYRQRLSDEAMTNNALVDVTKDANQMAKVAVVSCQQC
jgi:hypothetical protein